MKGSVQSITYFRAALQALESSRHELHLALVECNRRDGSSVGSGFGVRHLEIAEPKRKYERR